ncbi:biotin/lipoyl-binding protein, partial [Candidatus Gracilibacteria bacterium]|nr:biotin/lipoyl-binding protein [Candidatus Gracilibacteria bacterium]
MFKIKFSLKYFLLGLIIILGINYKTFYQVSEDESSSSGTTTEIVATGSIKNVIEVVGEAELVDEQSLQFTKEGTITKVNFKAGDSIKKGDIIAELDSSDAYDSIDEALISLDNAKISYEQLFDEADKSQILQAQNSITTAENNYTIAEKELENLKNTQANSIENLEKNIETAKKELESAVSSMELAKKELETTKKEQSNSLNNTVSNKSTTVQNIEDSFSTNLTEIEKIIEQSDYIMGVTNENKEKNDSFEDFLGAKNGTIKNEAVSSLLESITLYKKLKQDVASYNYSGDNETIKALLKQFLTTYQKLSSTTDLIYKTLENSVESIGTLSSSDIESKKNTMSSYRSSSQNKVISINSSINTLDTLTNTDLVSETNSNSIAGKEESIKTSELNIEKKKIDIENSEKTLETTKESYKITLESKEKDLDSKERSVEVAILNLEELLEGPTEENLQKAKNS